jgi:hypothetical protein
MATWFIETCVLSDERLAEFRAACAVHELTCATTLDADHPEPRRQRPPEGADVIAYGSKSVIAYAAERNWKPGAWAGDAFDYPKVHAGLRDHFLNADAMFTTLASAEEDAAAQGLDSFFIRPVDDNKAFVGMASSIAELPAWRARMIETGYLASAEIGVVLAPLQPLTKEWRLILVADEVVAASLYREAGGASLREGAPPEAVTLARSAAERYRPAPAFVLDVAETVEGRFAVVELNCINSADLYACNIADVVAAVSKAAWQLEGFHGFQMRNRRTAQRRQVHDLQRADAHGGGAGGGSRANRAKEAPPLHRARAQSAPKLARRARPQGQ